MDYQPEKSLLNDKIILVTGASDGIGRQAALTFAAYGANVILTARNIEKLNSVKTEIDAMNGHPALVIPFDLSATDYNDYIGFASEVKKQVTHLDGLLNNAGALGEITPIAQQTPAVWQQVMHINVNAQFMLTKALLPLLETATAPSIVFMSSSVGKKGRANWGAYSVSKFAVEGLMQTMSDEYPAKQLRINCINPGGTRTDMRADAFPEEDPLLLKTPAEIMPLFLYLMGDDSKNVTGESFDAQPKRTPGIAK